MDASEVHLSYSNGATDVPLIEKTIGRLFNEVCSTHEHNDALVSKHQALRYTYGELRKRVDEVGTVHPHVVAKVVEPLTGDTLPRDTSGELCVKGYLVMLGYWNNPEATKQAVDANGWMHTGDLAMMNQNGYLNIVGRTKDMISRGGEKVFPKEVEDFLYMHPKISDVQIIGVPSRRYGEEVMAWVKLKPGATATSKELTDYCKGKIAYFKIPSYFKFTDTYPMTVTGKIQKFKMREISTKELGLEEAAAVKTA